jgi:hypothetical protein
MSGMLWALCQYSVADAGHECDLVPVTAVVRRRGVRQRTLHQLVAVHQWPVHARIVVLRNTVLGSTCRASTVTGQ